MRRAVAAWARERGEAPGVVAMLEVAQPVQVRTWAARAGAPQSVLGAVSTGTRSWSGNGSTWLTAAMVDQVRAQLRLQTDDPDRGLLLGELTPAPVYLDGVNDVVRMRLSTGGIGYFKSFTAAEVTFGYGPSADWAIGQYQQPLHECAAARLARVLGPPWVSLVPPCVLRQVGAQLGSLSRGVENALAVVPVATIAQEERDDAAFFDAVVGQVDRHRSNHLLAPGGRLQLIDHGFAFPAPDRIDEGAFLFIDDRHARDRSALEPVELAALDQLLGSADTLGLAGVLEPERLHGLRERVRRMRHTRHLLSGDEI